MHYIQKHILDELRRSETVRYAKLNTIDIESGHFRYHLEQLIRDGYVQRLDTGLYGLTLSGQKLLDKMSEHGVSIPASPKVITYTLLTNNGDLLLHKKQKQPYKDLLNMVGGKLHEGEQAQAAAIREVQEKTSLMIDSPTLNGVFEVRITVTDKLLSHVVAYVFSAPVTEEQLATVDLERVAFDDLSETPNLAPDFLELFSRVSSSDGVVVDNITVALDGN